MKSRKSAYDTGGDGSGDGYRMDTYLHESPENVTRQRRKAVVVVQDERHERSKLHRVSTCFGMFMVNQTVQKKDGHHWGVYVRLVMVEIYSFHIPHCYYTCSL